MQFHQLWIYFVITSESQNLDANLSNISSI